ncbi:MAG: HK97 family phage prohead protease [Oscillospiraceae bacterium]|nr:HK97 family phage prohead protease [Oscillospiraceae bacterium]
MEKRCLQLHDMTSRSSEDGNLYLEGYFARYDDVYTITEGATESIAPGAFAESCKGDVRALYNHNTDIILGRTSAGTLTLKDTDVGLWGSILINQKDSQAMDAYQRISRGDVTGCSFGFDIPPGGQSVIVREDGSVHWTINRVDPLYEVSPVVFPAYEATSIEARMRELDDIRAKAAEAWRIRQKERLHHGA